MLVSPTNQSLDNLPAQPRTPHEVILGICISSGLSPLPFSTLVGSLIRRVGGELHVARFPRGWRIGMHAAPHTTPVDARVPAIHNRWKMNEPALVLACQLKVKDSPAEVHRHEVLDFPKDSLSQFQPNPSMTERRDREA